MRNETRSLPAESEIPPSTLRGLLLDFTAALGQQMFFRGRDLVHPDGNLLCEHGFDRRQSKGLNGTSCYRLSRKLPKSAAWLPHDRAPKWLRQYGKNPASLRRAREWKQGEPKPELQSAFRLAGHRPRHAPFPNQSRAPLSRHLDTKT